MGGLFVLQYGVKTTRWTGDNASMGYSKLKFSKLKFATELAKNNVPNRSATTFGLVETTSEGRYR
jgi:hypothetical protein